MTVLGGAHAPIAACWSPMWAQASPRGYIIIFSKSAFAQTERRTACHFTETNVQKCIKVKTISSSLLSRALLFFSVPKKQIRLKGVGVPSCLCVILRRVIITICRKIKWFFFFLPLCPFLLISLSCFNTIFAVQPSHWVHVSRQRLADSGSKEEKRGEWIRSLDVSRFCLFFSWVCNSVCFFFLMQIIEKRRRDRINHSLSELRRLVPSAFEKQVRNEFEMMIFFVIVRQ